MTTKYLDSNGLTYLLSALRPSTNPADLGTSAVGTSKQFAKADHVHKLPTASDIGLASVATSGSYSDLSNKPTIPTLKNVFGIVKVGTTSITADTTQDTLTLEAGDNVTLTPDATNDKVTIAATDTTYSVATTSANGLMSASDKTKLDGVASGAEVNQNAFSNISVGDTTIAADSETDTLTLTAGSNVTLTPNATSDTVTIAATDTTYSVITSDDVSNQTTYPRTITGAALATYLATKADRTSPALVGTPTAPTAAEGTNTTQIATTAFVKTAVESAVAGGAAYQGAVDGTFAPTNYTAGWYWIVQTAGTYAGEVCEPGDMIFCNTSASTYSASNFDVVQTNLDISTITNAEIDTIVAA